MCCHDRWYVRAWNSYTERLRWPWAAPKWLNMGWKSWPGGKLWLRSDGRIVTDAEGRRGVHSRHNCDPVGSISDQDSQSNLLPIIIMGAWTGRG